MLSAFIKAWVLLMCLLAILAFLIFGMEWLQTEFGTGVTIAVAAVLFIMLMGVGLLLRRAR